MACEIRVAQGEDSGDVSRVIIAALRSTNSQDYSPGIVERVEKKFQSRRCLGSYQPAKGLRRCNKRRYRGHGQS